MGLQTVGHDRATSLSLHTAFHWTQVPWGSGLFGEGTRFWIKGSPEEAWSSAWRIWKLLGGGEFEISWPSTPSVETLVSYDRPGEAMMCAETKIRQG